MRVWMFAVVGTLVLAGCAADAPAPEHEMSLEDSDGDGFVDAVETKYGTDPFNATSVPDVMQHKDISYKTTVTSVIGTGIPSYQCPADQVNSKSVVWAIVAPEGNVSDVHAANLEFTIKGAMTHNDVDLFVYGPEGSLMQSATTAANTETVTLKGHNPIGDYTIEVRGCSGAGDVIVEAKGQVGWTPSTEDLLADDHADDGHTH